MTILLQLSLNRPPVRFSASESRHPIHSEWQQDQGSEWMIFEFVVFPAIFALIVASFVFFQSSPNYCSKVRLSLCQDMSHLLKRRREQPRPERCVN